MTDLGKIKAPGGLFDQVDQKIRQELEARGKVVVFVDEWNYRHLGAQYGVRVPESWSRRQKAYRATIRKKS